MPPGRSPFLLTALTASHLPRIAALEETVFPEPMSLAGLREVYERPNARFVGYLDGEEVAAYFGFEVSGPTAHVVANVTNPAYRHRGLGGRILVEAEPLAKSLGARWYLGEVRLSNLVQRRVLSRIGWREVAVCPAFFGNGEDAYIVMKILPAPAGGR